jgi:hypothetical protein
MGFNSRAASNCRYRQNMMARRGIESLICENDGYDVTLINIIFQASQRIIIIIC